MNKELDLKAIENLRKDKNKSGVFVHCNSDQEFKLLISELEKLKFKPSGDRSEASIIYMPFDGSISIGLWSKQRYKESRFESRNEYLNCSVETVLKDSFDINKLYTDLDKLEKIL